MKRVLDIFCEICSIPHGSGNMEKISAYCMDFAEKNGLEAFLDDAKNVIIKKKGTIGLENAAPVILQGHMDMVCQKDEGVSIDFEKDGIVPVIEGDLMRAKGTTLGGDNGIAVAMILAILERDDLSHPPIEAVFTVDEEIGLIGAGKLEFSRLSGRRLINIDSEEEDTLTVSCAGGCDLILHLPIQREKTVGKKITVKLSGLKGGHSGIEIGNGRVNADVLMGRVLAKLSEKIEISLLSVSGGDKGNAIPLSASFEGVVTDADAFVKNCSAYLSEVKKELSQREPDFDYEVKAYSEGEFEAVGAKDSKRFFDALCTVPNGVIEMSPSIPNLVETSLNLGILKSEENAVVFQLMLRSNLYSALLGLEERVKAFARLIGATTTSFGHYPPWEYRPDSPLRDLYGKIYREEIGKDIRIEAIHAGLECGVISAGLPGIDCISIGPDLWDVHTTKERMSISSVNRVYQRIIKTLAKLG